MTSMAASFQDKVYWGLLQRHCSLLHSVENQYVSPNHSTAKIPDVHPQETYGMQDLQAVYTFCISFK